MIAATCVLLSNATCEPLIAASVPVAIEFTCVVDNDVICVALSAFSWLEPKAATLVVLKLPTCVLLSACTCVAVNAANTAVDKAFTWSVDIAVMLAGLSDARSDGVIAAICVVVHDDTAVVGATAA